MTRSSPSRRAVLRGMLKGAAVTVGLPILDCWLNDSGTAYAAGAALPVNFGTWFWGLGMNGPWKPAKTGQNLELYGQLQALAPYRDYINVFSGMQIQMDGKVLQTHYSGTQGIITGTVTNEYETYGGSLDTIISDAIGAGSRFRSLEACCDGNPRVSWSCRSAGVRNPSEVSPTAMYTRIFGPEFVDPNAANFTPDPAVMVRESVLSSVQDERQKLVRTAGASDRARLDEFFTGVRALEQKLQVQLTKPAPLPSCAKSRATDAGSPKTTLVDDVKETHTLFVDLLAHALACGQTRVVNICLSDGFSKVRRPNDINGHHQWTHEEAADADGYQPVSGWFSRQYMDCLATLTSRLVAIKEGDQTLLDRTVIFAHTDHGKPMVHSLQDYPLFTVGKAGGRIKTGYHIAVPGGPATLVGLTLQHAFDIPVSSWGTGSNKVSAPITDILA